MTARHSIALLTTLALLFQGCAALGPGQKKSSAAGQPEYDEDLSAWRPPLPEIRPAAPGEPAEPLPDSLSHVVTGRLNFLLDTVAAYSRATHRYVDGFSIQVFSGDSRSEARERQMEFLRKFPDSEPRLIFEQPNYKVRIGRYYSRLEAYEFYTRVKRFFPKAILVPVRIYL